MVISSPHIPIFLYSNEMEDGTISMRMTILGQAISNIAQSGYSDNNLVLPFQHSVGVRELIGLQLFVSLMGFVCMYT